MIEPGYYRARAVEASDGETSTGTPQVVVRFKILDAPGGFLTWYGFLSPRAREITIRGLEAAGWGGDDVFDHTWIEHAPECELVVEHETYQDKTRPRIKFINGTRGITTTAMDPGKRESYRDEMRAAVLMYRQDHPAPVRDRAAATPAPGFSDVPQDHLDAQAGSNAPANDEDIPF